MKPTDTLTTIFSHNLWANLGLLEGCAGLTNEQLAATIVGVYGSIYDTLHHMTRSEQSYLYRIRTGEPMPRPENELDVLGTALKSHRQIESEARMTPVERLECRAMT
jgi:uncharacterized damage-inducible protein DinB